MFDAPTVLLVDDSRASRLLCSAIIKSQRPELRLLEAAHGDAALDLLATERPDLAVLDMNMPGMSGLDLAERIRELYPTVKLAMLTANVQESIQKRAAALNVSFFRKPISESVVADLLRQLD